ncbi:MAG: adenine deaminase [Anaerolineae bacterium]
MTTMQARADRVAAARGDRPLDLLIKDVQLINVYTREIYPADIGISGGIIVFAGPGAWSGPSPTETLDGHGKFAVPGLIDTHIHIESSMMSPQNFAAAVLPRGTTTVVIDPHEIGNVLGLRGVAYMLNATAELPLRVYVQVPSCVPAVPQLETAGAAFTARDIDAMLTWDRVIGLAEVMDYVGVIRQNERMREILDVAHAHDAVISGHCPGLRGRDLAAYLVGGPRSDHESIDHDELLEKLRMGMVVEAKDSSFSESISALAEIVRELGAAPPNLVMCTDDIYPEDLWEQGHLDHGVRRAIAAGFNPRDAVRAATLHGAQRIRRLDLGAIAPGKRADLLLLDNLERFTVNEVFVDGRLVAQAGRLRISLPHKTSNLEEENTVHLSSPPHPKDFMLRVPSGKASAGAGLPTAPTVSLRVLTVASDYTRSIEPTTFPVRDGIVDLAAGDDVALVAIFERHGQGGDHSLVPVQGVGLLRGAVATTVAHDSHNLLVIGRNAEDMALAARTLADCGGGICAVDAGEVRALLPLPIAGLMSPEPPETVVSQMKALNAALRAQGITAKQPISPIIALALPVIPDYGVTDLGLVDVNAQRVLSIWPEPPKISEES